MMLGIVGSIACGKGIIAEYLIQKYGYTSFSLSKIVHEELERRGITHFTRTTLQDVGDELRKKEGEGIFAKRAIEELKAEGLRLKDRNIIIEGIRNRGEVEYLRTIPGFFLIAVDANQKIRFERVLKRDKPWDPKDWESFLKVDGRDSKGGDNINGQQVQKCMEMADVKIINNGSITEVQSALERYIGAFHDKRGHI